MTRGFGGGAVSRKLIETGIIAADIMFSLVPDIFEVASYTAQGTAVGPAEGVDLIGSLLVNSWVPFALAAPIAFVTFVMFLRFIGATEILEM